MPETDNLERLKSTYKAWNDSKGMDSLAWLDLMDDSFRLASVGEQVKALSFAKPRKSKQDAVDYLMSLTRDWRMVHWTPQTYVSQGDHIAMFGTCAWANKATGKIAEVTTAHLWRFKGSKAVEMQEVFDSARAVAAATP